MPSSWHEVDDRGAAGWAGPSQRLGGPRGKWVSGLWPFPFSYFHLSVLLFVLFCLYHKTFYKNLQLLYKNLGDFYKATSKFWRFFEFKLFESNSNMVKIDFPSSCFIF